MIWHVYNSARCKQNPGEVFEMSVSSGGLSVVTKKVGREIHISTAKTMFSFLALVYKHPAKIAELAPWKAGHEC